MLNQSKHESLHHTVIDDLESVVWVLFYEALIVSKAGRMTKLENNYLDLLLANDLRKLAAFKGAIRWTLYPKYRLNEWSKPVQNLANLLTPLFGLTIDAENASMDCFERLHESDMGIHNTHPRCRAKERDQVDEIREDGRTRFLHVKERKETERSAE